MRKFAIVIAFVLTLGSASAVFANVQNVGGGTWNYGTDTNWLIGKHSWSHYVHPSIYHSGTAICASNNVKVYAYGGTWANADDSCSVWQSAAQYWNTYP